MLRSKRGVLEGMKLDTGVSEGGGWAARHDSSLILVQFPVAARNHHFLQSICGFAYIVQSVLIYRRKYSSYTLLQITRSLQSLTKKGGGGRSQVTWINTCQKKKKKVFFKKNETMSPMSMPSALSPLIVVHIWKCKKKVILQDPG